MLLKFDGAEQTLTTMGAQGAFLTAGGAGQENVMTVGWGMFGVMWYKRILVVPVRESRYTKELIDKNGEFGVSVPKSGEFLKELGFCGNKSGRDVDKFEAAKLVKRKANKINTCLVDSCEKYYECKLICKVPLTADILPEDIKKSAYARPDYHVLYLGEIIAEN